jgi:hypothetical protein
VYRGTDYYCCEEYMLEEDETSLTYTGPVYVAESAAHCDIIRDVFGNPFRPVIFDRSWLSPTVSALVRGVADNLAFDQLPILADALEEAGCSSTDLLDRCRGAGRTYAGAGWCVCYLGRTS